MPRVVVVTAVKDAAAYLPAAIESIQRQSFRDWHYVIVDDASTDATSDIIAAAAAEDSRISLLRLDESVGSYAAANAAMLDADCEYLARLDADDVSEPSRLERQLAAFADHHAAKGCVAAWRFVDETGVLDPRVHSIPTNRDGVIKWMLWVRGGPVHSSLLVDTAWFHARGGYGPERIAEDYRLWCALARETAFALVDEPLVRYRVHGAQVTAEPGTHDAPARIRVRMEHIGLCASRSTWTEKDARDLRYIGMRAAPPFPLARAVELLDRWIDEWRHDAALDDADRSELAARAARMYVAHLWRSRKRGDAGVTRHALTHARRVAASLAGLRRPDARRSWAND